MRCRATTSRRRICRAARKTRSMMMMSRDASDSAARWCQGSRSTPMAVISRSRRGDANGSSAARLNCRFAKPVYDGRIARVRAEKDGDWLNLGVESDGILCATATAGLGRQSAPALEAYPLRPLPKQRPPADEVSLAPGTLLGTPARDMSEEDAEWYLSGVRESEPLYRRERIVHPGRILRLCNNALMDNVVLGPWIHVGSKVQHLSTAHVGEALSVRARVAGNYDKKGHRFVDLDTLVVASDERPIAHVLHTAIYRLRAPD